MTLIARRCLILLATTVAATGCATTAPLAPTAPTKAAAAAPAVVTSAARQARPFAIQSTDEGASNCALSFATAPYTCTLVQAGRPMGQLAVTHASTGSGGALSGTLSFPAAYPDSSVAGRSAAVWLPAQPLPDGGMRFEGDATVQTPMGQAVFVHLRVDVGGATPEGQVTGTHLVHPSQCAFPTYPGSCTLTNAMGMPAGTIAFVPNPDGTGTATLTYPDGVTTARGVATRGAETATGTLQLVVDGAPTDPVIDSFSVAIGPNSYNNALTLTPVLAAPPTTTSPAPAAPATGTPSTCTLSFGPNNQGGCALTRDGRTLGQLTVTYVADGAYGSFTGTLMFPADYPDSSVAGQSAAVALRSDGSMRYAGTATMSTPAGGAQTVFSHLTVDFNATPSGQVTSTPVIYQNQCVFSGYPGGCTLTSTVGLAAGAIDFAPNPDGTGTATLRYPDGFTVAQGLATRNGDAATGALQLMVGGYPGSTTVATLAVAIGANNMNNATTVTPAL